MTHRKQLLAQSMALVRKSARVILDPDRPQRVRPKECLTLLTEVTGLSRSGAEKLWYGITVATNPTKRLLADAVNHANRNSARRERRNHQAR